MKFLFAPVAAVLAATSALAQLTVNTPLSVVVCQPLLITWTGGTPPYFLRLLPGNQPTAAAILDFGTLTTTQLSWTVNVTAGTSLGLTLRDSTGAISQSAPFTVQSGSDLSCLTGSSSSSTGSAGSSTSSGTGSSTTAASSTTTAPVTTTSAVTTTRATTTAPVSSGTTTSRSGSSTTGSAAPSQSTAAAYNLVAKTGLVGAVGAAVVALLA